MKQTKAPKLTPSPSRRDKSGAVAGNVKASSVFVSMALDMSWRLAVVVIIPIVIGATIDDHYKVGALYLIIGLVLALALAILVVYQSYQEANKLTSAMFKGKKNAR